MIAFKECLSAALANIYKKICAKIIIKNVFVNIKLTKNGSLKYKE